MLGKYFRLSLNFSHIVDIYLICAIALYSDNQGGQFFLYQVTYARLCNVQMLKNRVQVRVHFDKPRGKGEVERQG